MFLLSITTLYFCHVEAKNVHHFVSSACKAENYLPRLLRFMLLITSYLLHYLPNLRITINSLIYGKNVKCLTIAGYHFLDFHLMLLTPYIFSTSFFSSQNWLIFQTYKIIHLSNNLYCLTADVNFTTSFHSPTQQWDYYHGGIYLMISCRIQFKSDFLWIPSS